MIKEHDCVVLTKNLPDESLEAGDVGTVVHLHKGGAGYEAEIMTLTGETVAIVTLLADQVLRSIVATLLTRVSCRPRNLAASSKSFGPQGGLARLKPAAKGVLSRHEFRQTIRVCGRPTFTRTAFSVSELVRGGLGQAV